MQPISHHTEFLTATILRWQHLLTDDKCRQILDFLAWLSKEGRCKVYGFVIMPNHIHLIWKIKDGYARQEVQAAFLSFTAHEFKKHLSDNKKLLNEYLVNDADRKYQFWERDSRVKECWNESFLLQNSITFIAILVSRTGIFHKYLKSIHGHRLLFTRQEIKNTHGFATTKIKHLGADASMSKAEGMLLSKVYHLPASYHVRTMFGLSSEVLRMYPNKLRRRSEAGPKNIRRNLMERCSCFCCSPGVSALRKPMRGAQAHDQSLQTLNKIFRM